METINEKTIGNFKIKFLTDFNHRKSQYIKLKISVSDDLRKLLKDCSVDELAEVQDREGINKFKRYLIRTWINQSIFGLDSTFSKETMFSQKLIDNGEFEIQVSSIQMLETQIKDYKQIIKLVVEAVSKAKIDTTMIVNVEVSRAEVKNE